MACSSSSSGDINTDSSGVTFVKSLTFDEAKENLQNIANSTTGSEYTNGNLKLNGISNNSNVSVIQARQDASRFTSSFPNLNFQFNFSNSFGSINSRDTALNGAPLIRLAAIGQPVFNVRTEIDGDDGTQLVTTIDVKQPSLNYVKLEYGKAVEITFTNGSTKIYDNDKHEKLPDFGTKFKETVYSLGSDDPRSVNNPQFQEDLKNADSFSFSVKDNMFWSDSQGNKTKYQIKAEDIFYSYMRTKLIDTTFRRNNGGSKLADDIIVGQTSNFDFQDDSEFPNEYLYPLFGVDGDALFDETQAMVTNSQSESAYRVSKQKGAANASLDLAFTSMFVDSALYLLAPSDYIKENTNKPENTTFSGSLVPNGPLQTQTITGLAQRFGTYWYARNTDKQLFAGSYIPSNIDVTGRSISWIVNPNYADQNWVNSPNKQNSIVDIYETVTDLVSFQSRLYNSFADGTITRLGFDQIPQQNGHDIRSDNDPRVGLDRLSYSVTKNRQSSATQLAFNAYPKADGDYKFNDNFSQVMYGVSTNDFKNGTAVVSDHYYKGDGLTFRTAINAAFNIVSATNLLTDSQRLPWISGLAPDVTIGGSDQSTSNLKTPRDAFEELNSIFAVNTNGSKIDISYQNYVDGSVKSDVVEQFKSPKFQELQTLMTNLLDKYPSITKDNPIKGTFTYHFIGWDNTTTSAVRQTVAAINSLDTKNRLQFETAEPNLAENVFPFTLRQQGITQVSGWGADYDGIGTFMHFLAGRSNFGLLGAMPLYADADPAQSPFPQFINLSQALRKGIADGDFKFAKDFASWNQMTNKDGARLEDYLNVKDPNDPKITTFNYDAELARFFRIYQGTRTNQQLIDLAKEMTVLRGSLINRTLITNNLDIGTPSLLQSGVIRPRTNGDFVWAQDVRFIERQ